MALFEFKLKPLQDVMPWGEEPELNLHWFGLTDGIYYMNVGEEQLFRSSNEIMEYWSKENPDIDVNQVFVDYQVIRLYEDLLEILGDVLQPIPDELQKYIETPQDHERWASELWNINNASEDEEVEDLFNLATMWYSCRSLSATHLNQGPNIWMWRTNETIHIRWNNELKEIDGIQPWVAVRGDFTLSVDDFKNEVLDFHQRLMSDMNQRIEKIVTNNPIPHIKIELLSLKKEHEERKQSLEKALSRTPGNSNWDKVIEAINRLIEPSQTNSVDTE